MKLNEKWYNGWNRLEQDDFGQKKAPISRGLYKLGTPKGI